MAAETEDGGNAAARWPIASIPSSARRRTLLRESVRAPSGAPAVLSPPARRLFDLSQMTTTTVLTS
jgi:hypothetical protein